MKKNVKVSYDKFVDAVRPDPKDGSAVALLSGFIGKSSEDNHIRLYSDASLNDFVEIPEESIVHSETMSKDESALGGSHLWVKSDTVVTTGNPEAKTRMKSQLLQGDLMEAAKQFDRLDLQDFNKPFCGFGRTPLCTWNNRPTLITCYNNRTPLCRIGRTKYCGNYYTPGCSTYRTPITCAGGRTPLTCSNLRTPFCGVGRTPITCAGGRTLVTCAGGRTPIATVVTETATVVFNENTGAAVNTAGTVGMPTPTEPIPTGLTPLTPVLNEPENWLSEAQIAELNQGFESYRSF